MEKKDNSTKKLSKTFGNSENIRTFAPPEPAKPLHDAQMCGSFYVYADEQQNSIPEARQEG